MPERLRFASTVISRAALMIVPKVAMSALVVPLVAPGAAAGFQFSPFAQLPAALRFQVASAASRLPVGTARIAAVKSGTSLVFMDELDWIIRLQCKSMCAGRQGGFLKRGWRVWRAAALSRKRLMPSSWMPAQDWSAPRATEWAAVTVVSQPAPWAGPGRRPPIQSGQAGGGALLGRAGVFVAEGGGFRSGWVARGEGFAPGHFREDTAGGGDFSAEQGIGRFLSPWKKSCRHGSNGGCFLCDS